MFVTDWLSMSPAEGHASRPTASRQHQLDMVDRRHRPLTRAVAPVTALMNRDYWYAKTRFQSSRMFITIQPVLAAASNALSSRPTEELRSYAYSRSASV